MIKSLRYKMLLRTLLSSVMGSRLSSAELQSLSDELRRGQLSDELAYMIDLINNKLGSDDETNSDDEFFKSIMGLIRQQKISKANVISIMMSLGVSSISSSASISTLIKEFLVSASPGMRRKFIDVLQSSSPSDPYLAGISNTRR